MSSSDLPEDLGRLLALTGEIPNYSERIARDLDCLESDLWSIYLAAIGRMRFPEQSTLEMPFPDGRDRVGGPTRYVLWNAALVRVLDILGPVEVRLRTGYEEAELRSALVNFFQSR